MSVSNRDRKFTEKEKTLIEENVTWVKIIVRAYLKKNASFIIEFDDMMAIGYEALCVCAKNYNPEIAKFNTFLTTAITRRIKREEALEYKRRSGMVSNTSEADYLLEIADTYRYDSAPEMEDEIVQIDALKALSEKLDAIMPGQLPYFVIFKHIIRGDTYRAIGKMYGKPHASIENQIKNIRRIASIYPQIFMDTFADYSKEFSARLAEYLDIKESLMAA